MKIGQPSELPALVAQAKASAASKPEAGVNASAAATASAGQSTRSAGVAVTVSSQARSLEKSSQSDAPDVDSQKVASVRAAIQGGTFSVNAEAIADKLLSNAQEMLGRTTR